VRNVASAHCDSIALCRFDEIDEEGEDVFVAMRRM